MTASSPTSTTESRSVWPMFLGALVMIGVFLVAALLLRSVAGSGARDEAEKAVVRYKNIEELRTADDEELTSYGWVDREKGVVRVPIAAAMEREVEILNSQKPRAAYAIASTPGAPATAVAPTTDAPAPAPDAAPTAAEPAATAESPAAGEVPAPVPAPAESATPEATPSES